MKLLKAMGFVGLILISISAWAWCWDSYPVVALVITFISLILIVGKLIKNDLDSE